ncbi:complement factor B-like [Centropristis striata]|uniref:complement factor B-like n=1 Tax=Centropristis striata TaxID=184440 RepID=UPI0027E197DC|nr:complement factor B-like [Centropristis striata]
MGSLVLWSWIAALSCLLCMGEVRCDCTGEGIQIIGGTYTLTNETREDSKLAYHCPEGYYPYPTLTRLCQASRWKPASKILSSCKVVECPDPNVLEHGSVLPPQLKYFVNNETTFECYSGYRLRGSDRRVCLPNGKWSGSTPICSHDSWSSCPDPGIPPGASRTGNIFNIGGTVKYSCSNNMILVGSKERVCQENGQWTGLEPACYYKHTYDTSLEATEAFGSMIKNTLTLSEPTGKLNIYIAVDISQSIDREYVRNATNAISQLIQKISGFSVTPNYEIIFFSSEVFEVVNILDFVNGDGMLSTILSKLEKFQRNNDMTRGTNLNLAFSTFLERMAVIKLRAGEEAFKEHRHVFILFTDGGYNMGGSPALTVEKIKNLVHSNVSRGEDYLDIFIFAVGAEIFDDDLQPLTVGGGGRHYFRMKYIGDLSDTFEEAIDAADVQPLCGLHKGQSYPWLANVLIRNKISGSLRRCLGSLVSPWFVLTAAHCFTFENQAQDITVEIDDGNNRVKQVKTMMQHPLFNVNAKKSKGVMEFYDYDVALLQLQEEVQISDNARPICIPCIQGTSDALGLFGKSTCEQQEKVLLTNTNEKLSFLTKRGTRVVEKTAYAKLGDNRAECIQHALEAPGISSTNATDVVTDNFLCTGGLTPARSDVSCKGDGGGPVFKNYQDRAVQVASVSWGNKELCSKGSSESDETSRDFHINLFRVVPFLKAVLGNDTQTDYTPLKFL